MKNTPHHSKPHIILFGGAFDPVHLGHQQVVASLLQQQLADEVWYVPTGEHDFGKQMTSAKHRLAMLELVVPTRKSIDGLTSSKQQVASKSVLSNQQPVSDQALFKQQSSVELASKVKIETCELSRTGGSHTFDTLEQLSKTHPDKQFSWVIGSDNLAKFHLWHNWQAMLQKYSFYIYPRQNFAMQPLYNGMIALNNFPIIAISSTSIREKVQAKQAIDDLVDKKVLAYIKQQGLYKDAKI